MVCGKMAIKNGRFWDGNGRLGITDGNPTGVGIIASLPAISPAQLGDPAFLRFHGVKLAYTAGAMANGISSEELVIALGQAGMLCSFGAAGLVPARVEAAIQRIQAALPDGPYAFNLIHSPSEENLERSAVNMYLKHGVHTVEASAFLGLTKHIVRYRASGLSQSAIGETVIGNKVIAKISRREVAIKFKGESEEGAVDGDHRSAGALAGRQPLCAAHSGP